MREREVQPEIGSHRSSVRTAAPLDTPISITGVRRVINSRVKVVEETAVTAEMHVLQMQLGVYSRSILSAPTSHTASRCVAFSSRTRLVIVCIDSGILCGTLSGFSHAVILSSLMTNTRSRRQLWRIIPPNVWEMLINTQPWNCHRNYDRVAPLLSFPLSARL